MEVYVLALSVELTRLSLLSKRGYGATTWLWCYNVAIQYNVAMVLQFMNVTAGSQPMPIDEEGMK